MYLLLLRGYTRSDAVPFQTISEATAGFEPAIGVLQTPALPLGHVATREYTYQRISTNFLQVAQYYC